MTSILLENPSRVSPQNAGCWIDFTWGDYAIERMITLAKLYGYQVQEDSTSENVRQWMNDNVAPDGYAFQWVDGEFFLLGE